MATGIITLDGNGVPLTTLNGHVAASSVPAEHAPATRVLRYDASRGSHANLTTLTEPPAGAAYDLMALVYRPNDNEHVAALALADAEGNAVLGGLRNNPRDGTIREWASGRLVIQRNFAHDTRQPGWTWLALRFDGVKATVQVWAADMGAKDFGAGYRATAPDETLPWSPSSPVVPGFAFLLTASAERYFDIGWLGYGTNGDAAPLPGEATAPHPEPKPDPEPEEPEPEPEEPEPEPEEPEPEEPEPEPEDPDEEEEEPYVPPPPVDPEEPEEEEEMPPPVPPISGPVINVVGRHVSNKQMDIRATTDAGLGRQRLQRFIDNCASDNVTGFIDEKYWAIDNTVYLHSGQRLVGRGMHFTTIDCPTKQWSGAKFYGMRLTASRNNKIGQGCYLSDFGLVGADKTRRDDGPLVRLDGLVDGVIERMRFEDASSYGCYVSGYGLGNYVNEIDDKFWNTTFRVVIRDCLALRGQIGFGTEGGAEAILVEHNTSIGNTGGGVGGLHGFRSASGYAVRYIGNQIVGYRNGFLLDRHRELELMGNNMRQVRNGICLGSFYERDRETSTSTRIMHNYFNCNLKDGGAPNAVTDSYIGNREVNGVTIAGNQCREGGFSLRNSKRVNIYGNTALTGKEKISITSGVSGVIHGNLMDLIGSSSRVRTTNNGA